MSHESALIYDEETLILLCFVAFLRFAYVSFGSDMGSALDERQNQVQAECDTRKSLQSEAFTSLMSSYALLDNNTMASMSSRIQLTEGLFREGTLHAYQNAFEAHVLQRWESVLELVANGESSVVEGQREALISCVLEDINEDIEVGTYNFDGSSFSSVVETFNNEVVIEKGAAKSSYKDKKGSYSFKL